MSDNQVFTNPSNWHCSMSQPVQNFSNNAYIYATIKRTKRSQRYC